MRQLRPEELEILERRVTQARASEDIWIKAPRGRASTLAKKQFDEHRNQIYYLLDLISRTND